MELCVLARELGNPLARRLQLRKKTQLWYELEVAAGINFRGTPSTGVTALDIERQQGRFLLAGGASGSIHIYDLQALSSTTTLTSHSSTRSVPDRHRFTISSLSFYPADPALFISSSNDKTVKVWDTNAMAVAHTFPLAFMVHSAAISPHSTLVAVSSESPAVRLLDLNSGTSAHTLVGHTGAGSLAMAWSPAHEHFLATGGFDGTLRLWDVRRAASCLASLSAENRGGGITSEGNLAHKGAVTSVLWTADARRIVSLGMDERIRVWDAADATDTLTKFAPGLRNRRARVVPMVLTAAQESDPQLLFVPSEGSVVGFDMVEGDIITKQQVASPDAKLLGFTRRPSHPHIFTGATDGKINALMPYTPDVEETNEEEESKTKKPNVLDTVYRSLTDTPITFT